MLRAGWSGSIGCVGGGWVGGVADLEEEDLEGREAQRPAEGQRRDLVEPARRQAPAPDNDRLPPRAAIVLIPAAAWRDCGPCRSAPTLASSRPRFQEPSRAGSRTARRPRSVPPCAQGVRARLGGGQVPERATGRARPGPVLDCAAGKAVRGGARCARLGPPSAPSATLAGGRGGGPDPAWRTSRDCRVCRAPTGVSSPAAPTARLSAAHHKGSLTRKRSPPLSPRSLFLPRSQHMPASCFALARSPHFLSA